jgi:hypothetical protein
MRRGLDSAGGGCLFSYHYLELLLLMNGVGFLVLQQVSKASRKNLFTFLFIYSLWFSINPMLLSCI